MTIEELITALEENPDSNIFQISKGAISGNGDLAEMVVGQPQEVKDRLRKALNKGNSSIVKE